MLVDKNYRGVDILFEDNHLLVVSKPQNMPSQPDASNDLDLYNLLKEYRKENENKPGDAFIGIVHRLDRPTGGVMVFAKTSKAASRLTESMKNGDFEKKYLAVVRGTPKERRGNLVDYLLKDEDKNIVLVLPTRADGAKEAILDYKLLEAKTKTSLLEVVLTTGRSHQIRVQLSNIGVPIFGDMKYGAKENGDIKGKNLHLALWAHMLKFEHPITHEKHVFISYPPLSTIPWSLFDIETHLKLIVPKD